MKKMKKIMALVIVAMMMMGLALNTNAASITINQGDDSIGTNTTEYAYYQLLHATINADNENQVVYYLNSSAEDALKELLDAVTVEVYDVFTFTKSADGTRWIVTINTKTDDAKTAFTGEEIAAAVNTTAIKNAALAHDTFDQDEATGNAKAEGLAEGYYLITSTLGSKLVVDTLKDVTIETKNEYITNSKTASTNNMAVGDKVVYTIAINIPATAKVGDTITVHDTLAPELAILNGNEEIAADENAFAISAAYKTTIDSVESTINVTLNTVEKNVGETFARSFVITEGMLGKTVEVTYKAELLSSAADDTGYVNSAFVNAPGYQTVTTTESVYTFDINLDKTFQGIDDTSEDADKYSATFELRTDAADASTAILFTKDNTGYVKADSNDTANKNLVVTGGEAINIRGLKAGTYYLVETATSAGYNLLTNPIEVIITDKTVKDKTTGEVKTIASEIKYKMGTEEGTGDIKVLNNSGTELPSTGGMGTTILYVVGGILVVAAVVLLFAKKRVEEN